MEPDILARYEDKKDKVRMTPSGASNVKPKSEKKLNFNRSKELFSKSYWQSYEKF